MPKTTISARKHRINPDWEKRREEREQRIAERDKRRDETFEKLVTAATAILEQIKAQQDATQQFNAIYAPEPARTLSETAQRVFEHMGNDGYILKIRSKGRAELVYPPTRGLPKVTLGVNLKAAHELIDSGLLKHLEVEQRNSRLGLIELGLYAKGNFYACLQ
jgi:hypothetical protein